MCALRAGQVVDQMLKEPVSDDHRGRRLTAGYPLGVTAPDEGKEEAAG